MLTEKYKGVEIAYDEKTNRWLFTLDDGRERSSESLLKAKERIDKGIPKNRPKFEPIEVWWNSWGKFVKVTITSLTDAQYLQDPVWIRTPDGQRSKESATVLFPMTTENNAIITKIEKLKKDRDAISEKINQAAEELQCWSPPPEEKDAEAE